MMSEDTSLRRGFAFEGNRLTSKFLNTYTDSLTLRVGLWGFIHRGYE